MNENAIVTFVVGKNYLEIFNIVKDTWRIYAEKCNADLIIFNDYINKNSLDDRSPIWQKLLLVNSEKLKKYKKVCYLDSDIYINIKSPSIFNINTSDKVGVVRHETLFYPESKNIINERWFQRMGADKKSKARLLNVFQNYYENYGLKLKTNLKFNAGVLVFDPKLHGQFFERIYWNYPKDAIDQDQTAVNYELIKNELYQEIDIRFNAQIGVILSYNYPYLNFMDDKGMHNLSNQTFCQLGMMCILNIIEINYFTHFAGVRWPMLLLEHVSSDLFEKRIDFEKYSNLIFDIGYRNK